MDDLIDVCVKHMINQGFTEEQARAHMKATLPTLDYWKKYEQLSDDGQFEMFKEQLIKEINELPIEGMPKVEKLNALVGLCEFGVSITKWCKRKVLKRPDNISGKSVRIRIR